MIELSTLAVLPTTMLLEVVLSRKMTAVVRRHKKDGIASASTIDFTSLALVFLGCKSTSLGVMTGDLLSIGVSSAFSALVIS